MKGGQCSVRQFMINVVGVRFKAGGKVYFFDPTDLKIEKDDYVIVDTARGLECGLVVQGVHGVTEDNIIKPLKPVTRIATESDVEKMHQNRKDEKKAFDICLTKIEKHNLDMKLIDVEYTFDRSKVTLQADKLAK